MPTNPIANHSPILRGHPPIFPSLPQRWVTFHGNRTPLKNTQPGCSPTPAHAAAPTSTSRSYTHRMPSTPPALVRRNRDPATAPAIHSPKPRAELRPHYDTGSANLAAKALKTFPAPPGPRSTEGCGPAYSSPTSIALSL